MKKSIQMLIVLFALIPSLNAAPNPASIDLDKALFAEDPSPDQVTHADVVERLEKLEREVYFLDQQIVSISKQLLEKHGLYIIRLGDTLGKISKTHDMSLNELLELNAGLDPRQLEVGQIIRIRNENAVDSATKASISS